MKRDRDEQPGGRDDLRRGVEPDDPVDRLRGVDRQVLPQLALAEAVERDRADHHRDEEHRPGVGVEPRQAAERRPQPDHAVARLPDRDPREEVEVDGEALAVPRPGLGPEDRLHDQRVDRVAQRGGGQRRRVVAPARHELDPGEDEQRDRRRVAAPGLRVGPEPRQPDRPPRRERAEHVAEQHAQEHEPDPEVDQDERRGEVVERRAAPDVARQQDHHEQGDADQRAQPLDRARAEHPPDPGRQRPPAGLLEPRRRPQHREPRERRDEHDRRRPAEQPLGDREVGALDEPVRLGGRRGEDQRRRRRGRDGEPRPSAHSAVWSARSKASRPNEPSSRAVTRPSLPTTNSHGSVCRLNACSGGRSPLAGSLSV